MNKETENAIRKLLYEKATLINQDIHKAPHNYTSVRDCIVQLELQQEIEALKAMLDDTMTFEQQFRERCAVRELDTEHTIPYHAMLETPTNQMYWQIAQQVFEPQTMREMLGIVLPGIKKHLKVDIHYISTPLIPYGLRIMRPQVILELLELDDRFTQNHPSLETLMLYVLSDDTLFDVHEIGRFTLNQHAELKNILKNQYPAFAKKLYEHNTPMQELSLDILTLNNKGITPKAALQQLIKGLILGGKHITGEWYAGNPAHVAVEQFFQYFNALTHETKEQLRALEGNKMTLGHIIDNQIGIGECVELTAKDLNCILQQNRHKAILTALPEMSPCDLKKLKDKYKPNVNHPDFALDTKKDGLLMPALPVQLTKVVIQRIAPKTPEQLIDLMLDFSPTFYDALWESITLDNPGLHFDVLTASIHMGLFNTEQKKALTKAIVKNYHRFGLKESILFQALKTNSLFFLQEALGFCPEQQRLEVVRLQDEEGLTVLHGAILLKSKWLKTILKFLPEDLRMEALQVTDSNGLTPTHFAAIAGHSKIIAELVRHKVNLNVITYWGLTPAFIAAQEGHTEVIVELIKFDADFDIPSLEVADNLRKFAESRGTEILDRMNQFFSTRQYILITPYQIACIMGHQDIIQLLNKKAHDSNKTPPTTGLFSISRDTLFQNYLPNLIKKYGLRNESQRSLEKGLRHAAAKNQIEDLNCFIRCVKNLNAIDANPKMLRTALHWAAIKGNGDCYQLLIQANADPMIVDADGKTAVDYMELTAVQSITSP